VNKKGEALFPIMPYPAYNQVSEEDLYAVIAYIRTLKPIESRIPTRQISFPESLLVRAMPMPYQPKSVPSDTDEAAYGRYVTAIASCASCHTPTKGGKPIEGMEFAGGSEFALPNGQMVRASNITPDPETGIGNWSREDFLARFELAASEAADHVLATKHSANTLMPWIPEAGMTRKDLGSIYSYLRTVKPVRHNVEVFPPAR
jgi:mono/diheme cytochrome c family protein